MIKSEKVYLHNLTRIIQSAGGPPYFKEVVDHEAAKDNIAEIVDQEHDGDEVNLFTERDKSRQYEEGEKNSKIDEGFKGSDHDLKCFFNYTSVLIILFAFAL